MEISILIDFILIIVSKSFKKPWSFYNFALTQINQLLYEIYM